MIKTIVNPAGSKNIAMTEQEISQRNLEISKLSLINEIPSESLEDRLNSLQKLVDDIINRGVAAVKRDMEIQ